MINCLRNLLEYFEENIDLKHVQEVEKMHINTLKYESMPFLPLSIIYPVEDSIKTFSYEEAFDDPEKMLYNELLCSFSSNLNSIKIKDYFPLQIRSNHGVGIIASLFGAKCRIVNNNMPWVDCFKDKNEILKIIDRGIPEFTSGLGKKVIETYKSYNDILKEYPKCYKAIHITQPDLQGPFDIAHLLVGPDIFYEVYDNPDVIHKLLKLVTCTYIGFSKLVDQYLTDSAGNDAVYVHGAIYGGKIIIKDDTAAINLSQAMYNEFSKQYNDEIFKAFSGGSLHHCGQQRTWHFDSFKCRYLKGINFGNPEMHALKDTYEFWSGLKVPIIGWGYNQEKEFLKDVYTSGIKTGVSLSIKAKNYMEAKEILERHTARGEKIE